ncbi:MAG: hypothetical protein L3K04_03820 [Thermoplasmata archaeon]|nr:hypothetical protein [Thermoplasmata archaeon]MCI4341134.1 hypothetical protein [Thermoplasmata archaeon]
MDSGTLADAAYAGVAVLGAALTALSLLAVRRSHAPRMYLVSVGFLLLTLQGVYVGLSLVQGGADPTTLLLVSALFEAAVLVVLFLATLLR